MVTLADARDTFCHSLLRRCQVQAPNVSTRLFCHCLQVWDGCSRNLWLKLEMQVRWAPVVVLYESFCFPACPDFSPSINSAAEKVAYFYRRGGLKRTFQWQYSIQWHKSRSQSVCDEHFLILFPPFGITITCTSALLIRYPTSICLLKAELSPINRYGSTVVKFLRVHRSEKVVWMCFLHWNVENSVEITVNRKRLNRSDL